jgi:hypothetical protein
VLRTAYDANNKQSLKVSSYPFENVNFFEKPYKIARTNLLGPSTVGTRHSVFKLSTAPAMRRAKKSPPRNPTPYHVCNTTPSTSIISTTTSLISGCFVRLFCVRSQAKDSGEV